MIWATKKDGCGRDFGPHLLSLGIYGTSGAEGAGTKGKGEDRYHLMMIILFSNFKQNEGRLTTATASASFFPGAGPRQPTKTYPLT